MLLKTIRDLSRDNSGNVMILTGLALLVLIAVAGASTDFGRATMVRLKLQQATDAAALAGALVPTGLTPEQKDEVVKRYFALNYPNEFAGVSVSPDNLEIRFLPDYTNTATVQVGVGAVSDTRFIDFVDYHDINVAVNSKVGSLTTIQDFDMVLTLDTSGSMNCRVRDDVSNTACNDFRNNPTNRINELKDASKEALDTLLAPHLDLSKSRVGILEWSAIVKGRVELTNDRNALKQYVNAMEASGNTAGGIAAIRTVSQSSPSMFNPTPPRATDGQTGASKIMIFITDGEFNSTSNYRFYDRVNGNELCGTVDPETGLVTPDPMPFRPQCRTYQAQARQEFVGACNEFKRTGGIIYTIGFGYDVNNQPGLQATLRNCSSGEDFAFLVPEAGELREKLLGITGKIQKIRLTE